MSNLSEKEIIKQFEHWIEYEKKHKDKINKADDLIEIQEGLLNLYNNEVKISHYLQSELDMTNARLIEEKEKNKELEQQIINLNEEIIINKNLMPNEDNFYKYYNYISKDKIKDKIKELENEKDLYFEKQIIQGRINVLQELLEEDT